MKPKTKFQSAMCELYKRLPKITPEQVDAAYNNILRSYFTVSRNRFFCLDCGHKWKPEELDVKTCTCPSCNTVVTDVEKQNFTRNLYSIGNGFCHDGNMSIVTVVEGVQVVQTVYVSKDMWKKCKPELYWSLVSVHFTTPELKSCVFSKLSSYNTSGWSLSSPIELRSYKANDPYALVNIDYVYKDVKVMPIVKRNGFKKKDMMLLNNPQLHIYHLLNTSKYETLIKANQEVLAKFLFQTSSWTIEGFWGSIKIALRNNYIVKDPSMWFDTLWFVKHFNKDLLNVKYVCPKDLKAAHNHWSNLKAEQERKEEEQRRQQLEADQKTKEVAREKAIKEYPERMKKFEHLFFTDGTIEITPIMTVEEMRIEGMDLFHCVYTREYYDRTDSLILSAKIDGERVETIEVKLDTFAVEQSRGYDNKATMYNEQIVALVEKNMKLIKKAYRGQKIKQPLKLAS